MNHPYERLGIITSVVILVAVLAVGMVMMNTPYEHDKVISPSGGDKIQEQLEKYVPWVPKPIHND